MNEPPGAFDRLHVFHGAATPVVAHVYVEIPRPVEAPADAWQLTGTLQGPFCSQSRTLVATQRFDDRGMGATLLAEAIIPDPCFWTAELPACYRAELELRHAGNVVERRSQLIGLRRLGTRGRHWNWQGSPWVPRGVMAREIPATDDQAWRETATVRIETAWSLESLRRASESGVPCLAWLEESSQGDVESLLAALQLPALLGVVCPLDRPIDPAWRARARNVSWGQRVACLDDLARVEGADWLVVDSDDLEQHVAVAMMTTRPVLACRRLLEAGTLVEARRACDTLQRDLAGRGDFAGYLV